MNASTSRPTAGAEDGFDCDVLVIGGGPAGSTVGALLARQGRDVVVLDKDVHPRFHIGESLLPANMPLLDDLGVGEEMRAIGMEKWGVELVSPDHDHRTTLEFSQATDPGLPMALQVRRSEFDHILLRNAARVGARVHEGMRVRELQFEPAFGGGTATAVDGQGQSRQWRARFIVDATGRDTLLGNQLGFKQRNPDHASTALYGHFTGCERLTGREEGNITIFWFEHGWFWFIPLADGTTSVGAVTWPYYLKTREGRPLDRFLADTIALCEPLQQRMAQATLVSPVHATGNYSYGSRLAHGGGSDAAWLVAGDAYAFIDPVFSSGVFLAMKQAYLAVEPIEVALAPAQARAGALRSRQLRRALSRYKRRIDHGPRQFSWFIYRMTNPVIRDMFMNPRDLLGARAAVLSVLAGDLYRGTRLRLPLAVFRSVYRMLWLSRAPQAWAAQKRRRRNVRELQEGV